MLSRSREVRVVLDGAGSGVPTGYDDRTAETRGGGQRSLVSHRTAVYAWGMGDLDHGFIEGGWRCLPRSERDRLQQIDRQFELGQVEGEQQKPEQDASDTAAVPDDRPHRRRYDSRYDCLWFAGR